MFATESRLTEPQQRIANTIIQTHGYSKYKLNNAHKLSVVDIDEWYQCLDEYNNWLKDHEDLDNDQQRFIDTAVGNSSTTEYPDHNKIIFATGPGGCGKSNAVAVLKQRLSWKHAAVNTFHNVSGSLKELIIMYIITIYDDKQTILVTAPTGIAAESIGGQTYHSALNWGTGFHPNNGIEFARFVSSNMLQIQACNQCGDKKKHVSITPTYQTLKHNIRTIIIDEVSMVSAYVLDTMDKYLQYIQLSSLIGKHSTTCLFQRNKDGFNINSMLVNNKRILPFGGIQIILMGDLFQLQPIPIKLNIDDNEDDQIVSFSDEPFYKANVFQDHERYIGMSDLSRKNNNRRSIEFLPIMLNGRYRFKNDVKWGSILHRIREGSHTKLDIKYVLQNCSIVDRDYKGDVFTDITITSFNKKCDEINKAFLNKLMIGLNQPSAKYKVNQYPPQPNDTSLVRLRRGNLDKMLKDLNIKKCLNVCMGGRVMITTNIEVPIVEFENLKSPINHNIATIVRRTGYMHKVKNGTRGQVYGISKCDYWAADVNGTVIQDEDGSYTGIPNSIKSDTIYVDVSKHPHHIPIIVEIRRIDYSEMVSVFADIDYQNYAIQDDELVLSDTDNSSYYKAYEDVPFQDALIVIRQTGTIVGIVDSIDTNANLIYIKYGITNIGNTIDLLDANQIFHYRLRKVIPRRVNYFKYMPLRLAWAITTHKSQGLSLDTAIVHPPSGRMDNCGAFYVALSRVETLNGLKLALGSNIDLDQFNVKVKTNNEIQRFYNQIKCYYDDNSRVNTSFDLTSIVEYEDNNINAFANRYANIMNTTCNSCSSDDDL